MMTDNIPQAPDSAPGLQQAPASPDDAWLESLLREDAAAAPYVADDGFTHAVIAALPARRRWSPRRWIVPGMGLLGFVVGLVWLSGGEILSMNLASLAYLRSLSLGTFLAAVLPLGLLYWLAVSAAWQET